MSEVSSSIPLNWNDAAPASCRVGAVAIGNFDGVHRGHAALIDVLREQARAVDGPAIVLSFDPHPLQILAPDRFQPLLTTPADPGRSLKTCGADEVVFLHTSPELLRLTPVDFFHRL